MREKRVSTVINSPVSSSLIYSRTLPTAGGGGGGGGGGETEPVNIDED